MKLFIEDDYFLTEENKNFINNIVLSNNFPYYIQKGSLKSDNKYILYHTILKRPEDRKEGETFNSSFHPGFSSIVYSFFKKHNIKSKEILRMSVNYTFNNTHKKSGIHTDHNYKHNQLLVCLNDPEDKNAKTVILNKKDKIFKSVVPKQYNGICFSSVPHYMYFPKFGHRIMFVCTFR